MKSLVDVKMAQQGRQLGLEASFFWKRNQHVLKIPKIMQAQNIYESKALYLYNKSMNMNLEILQGIKTIQCKIKIKTNNSQV